MRVAIAEDSVLLREGLARLLSDSGFDVSVHRTVWERGKILREDDFFTR